MDEKNTNDFIHETIIPDKNQGSINKKGLLQSLAGGAVFGLAALLVFGSGSGIMYQIDSKPEETVAETQEAPKIMDEDTVDAMINKALKKLDVEVNTMSPETQIMDALDTIRSSSVSIERESKNEGLFEDAYHTRDTLSGVVIGRNQTSCYILANASGLSKNDKFIVKFDEDSRAEADLVKKDNGLSLALLKVDADQVPKEIRVVKKAVGDILTQGQAVLWYGSPSGIQGSLGYGHVSRICDEINLQDGQFRGIEVTSEVDCEDGSFLYNLDGVLCGIAYNRENLPDSVPLTAGYSMALSMDSMISYVNAMVEGKKVAALGIFGLTVTPELEGTYGMPQGVYVTEVAKKSAAYKAGIQSGDVLTSLNGEAVSDVKTYQNILMELDTDTELTAVIYRNSKDTYSEMKMTMKPGKR